MRMKATKMLRLIGANSSHHRHLTCLEDLNSKSQYRSKSNSTHLGSSMQSRPSYRHNRRMAAGRKPSMTAGVSAGRRSEVRWRDRPYLPGPAAAPGAARRWLATHAVPGKPRRTYGGTVEPVDRQGSAPVAVRRGCLAAHAVHRDRQRLGRLRAARPWRPSQPGSLPVERGACGH